MKLKLHSITFLLGLAFVPYATTAQTVNLGAAANFVLFSSNGALTNTGISHLTGDVGTNNGSSTGFGNVNGIMQNNNASSASASSDLLIAYGQLNSAVPAFFPAPLLGNGQTVVAGVYSIAGNASLNLDLILDAQNNASAVFIFQIQGAFSANAASKVKLINGAKACNVFWKVEGLVSLASGCSMKGNIVANNAAINLTSGDTLEGRALSINGAVSIDGILGYSPIGCNSPVLSGPASPTLNSANCYAIFSGNGSVSNTGISTIIGDVGTNVGLTTGFSAANVTGSIHPIPDGSTGACSADLGLAYTYLNTLPYDIELLYPAQFGNNLVLTPHVYRMNGLVTFTDTLFLNAQGNANAVFVIQINGAMNTSTYAKVNLMNGTQAKNVYWKLEGSLNVADYSELVGTIVCNNSAINLNNGVVLHGRALTTDGAVTTASVQVSITAGCGSLPTSLSNSFSDSNPKRIAVSPNPFSNVLMFTLLEAESELNVELYDVTGKKVKSGLINSEHNTLDTSILPSGLYIYILSHKNNILQTGKIISQQ